MTMTPRPEREQFVEDELMRVPMVADQVLDATFVELQNGLAAMHAHERTAAADLLQSGRAQRHRLVERCVASVREQVRGEIAGRSPAGAAIAPAPRGGLTLLDENEVAADVEVSRALEAIESVAEHELRELATFTAALAGDMDLAGDHNPFRPETWARALWDGVQQLPMSRGHQVMLMRHACMPLAQVLRKAYAGTCARLEASGIEPATYRTLILPAGTRTHRPGDSWQGEAPDLRVIRETMPAPLADSSVAAPAGPSAAPQVPLDRLVEDAERAIRKLPRSASPTIHAELMGAQRRRMVRHARDAEEQQRIELLGRLFETMLSDKRIGRDVRAVIARLQPPTLRLVLREPQALEDYTHPVWRFMDQVVHLAGLYGEREEGREAFLLLCESLIEAISADPAPTGDLYRRGLARLAAEEQVRLRQRLSRLQDDITTLQALEDELQTAPSDLPTGFGPLDVSQLETVPAELLDNLPEPRNDLPDVSDWLAQRKPGDWVYLFRQGHWIQAQLLWVGQHGDVWLFSHGRGERTSALRLRALERLYSERLLRTLHVRSMLHSAAISLVRESGESLH
jgi:hypothetical protein